MLINERQWGLFVYLMVSEYWLGLCPEFLEHLVGFEGKSRRGCSPCIRINTGNYYIAEGVCRAPFSLF